jgi:acyl carrier protein
MVPAQFVTVKQFPLTPNGKVDLKQLPRPEGIEQSSHAYVAPRSTEEIGLAEIWQEVLMLNKLGIDDNFFELGGDSLSATRAYARANKAFGMALTLREMLDRPTIRSLAELVTQVKGTAPQQRTIIPRQPRAPVAST